MKSLCLGTALWGWKVKKELAFRMLDCYYDAGYRYIDTATNYPINENPGDYSLALRYISEWMSLTQVHDLKVIAKIGSVSNANSSDFNLKYEKMTSDCKSIVEGLNISPYCIMIHWDDRNVISQIEDTLLQLRSIVDSYEARIGLSGIRNVESYKKAIEKVEIINLDIEAKINPFNSAEHKYGSILNNSTRLWAYGISGSGLKINKSEYSERSYLSLVNRSSGYHEDNLNGKMECLINSVIRKKNDINNLYEFSMAYAELHAETYGYIISPSSLDQCQQTIITKRNVSSIDFQNNFREMVRYIE